LFGGIALTLIPFVSMGALVINNPLIRGFLMLIAAIGFPFYLAYHGVRRTGRGRSSDAPWEEG
jgi:hypothetical protein